MNTLDLERKASVDGHIEKPADPADLEYVYDAKLEKRSVVSSSRGT